MSDSHAALKADLEEMGRMLSGLIYGLDKRGSPPAAERVRPGMASYPKQTGGL